MVYLFEYIDAVIEFTIFYYLRQTKRLIMKRENSEVISVEIASMVNKTSGETIMYIHNKKGGPIVFGQTIDEAKRKMKEAFGVSLIAASFVVTIIVAKNF